jgi:hypothetical protein
MKWWFAVLGVLTVLAVGASILVAGSRTAPGPVMHEGETHTFTAGDVFIIGEVLEAPRDHWVKVRIINNKSKIPTKVTWVNLQQFKAVSLVDPKDVPKDVQEGAGP